MTEPRAKKPSPPEAAKKKNDDVALVCGTSEDGSTLGVLRKRGEKVQAAIMRRARDGQPIQGELVKMTPREEPLLFDCETVYAPEEAATPASGRPAQVASDRYRKGWERLFAAPKRRSSAAN